MFRVLEGTLHATREEKQPPTQLQTLESTMVAWLHDSGTDVVQVTNQPLSDCI